jgi:DNA polymerase-3 subunit beta
MHLTGQDIDFSFEGNERMACQYNGDDISISFNARFLIEMLGGTESEEVGLELSTPTKAGLLKPVDQDANEDLLMLAMPLMAN